MEINIKDFRCYISQKSFVFEKGSTLINGPNGVGKSTVLESILFALYSGKINIYPRSKTPSSCHTCVEFKFENVTVRRYKNPVRLEVFVQTEDQLLKYFDDEG